MRFVPCVAEDGCTSGGRVYGAFEIRKVRLGDSTTPAPSSSYSPLASLSGVKISRHALHVTPLHRDTRRRGSV